MSRKEYLDMERILSSEALRNSKNVSLPLCRHIMIMRVFEQFENVLIPF